MSAIYFAGAEIERLSRALIDNGVRRVLFSFYYIVLMNRFDFIDRLQKEYPEVEFFLDSGAFTYFAKYERDPDKLMNLSDYKKLYFQYIDSSWQRWVRITELDMDDMFEDITIETLAEWREEMLELWPKAPIMPVWHEPRGPEEWNLYCRDSRIRHLAIGSGRPKLGLHRRMVMEARKWNKTVHGFGMTNVAALNTIPYDTVDSSSWSMGQKYGTLFVFRHNKFKRVSAFDARGKAVRKEYRNYFRNIGCDPDLVFADDLAETRKANIIAWRNLSNRFEEMRKRQGRSLDGKDFTDAPRRNEDYPWEAPEGREQLKEAIRAKPRDFVSVLFAKPREEVAERPGLLREEGPSGDQAAYAASYQNYEDPQVAADAARKRRQDDLPQPGQVYVTDRKSELEGSEGNRLTWFLRGETTEGPYARARRSTETPHTGAMARDGEEDDGEGREGGRDGNADCGTGDSSGTSGGVPGGSGEAQAGASGAGGRSHGGGQNVRSEDADDDR